MKHIKKLKTDESARQTKIKEGQKKEAKNPLQALEAEVKGGGGGCGHVSLGT